jgi:hypothetical protein
MATKLDMRYNVLVVRGTSTASRLLCSEISANIMIFGRRTKLSPINDEMQGGFVFVGRELDVVCEMFFVNSTAFCFIDGAFYLK